MPIVMNTTSNIFEHLGDVVFVVDEPAGIEGYLSEFYERLSERYREIDQADDIALTPDELFSLPKSCDSLSRCDSASSCAHSAASLLKQISIWRWTPKPPKCNWAAHAARASPSSYFPRSKARWKSNGNHNRRCAITGVFPTSLRK